jgi:hypothetical protein
MWEKYEYIKAQDSKKFLKRYHLVWKRKVLFFFFVFDEYQNYRLET